MTRPSRSRLVMQLSALTAAICCASQSASAATDAEFAALQQRLNALEAKLAQQPTIQISAAPASSLAAISMSPNTTFSYKGYVKVDALASRFSAGELASSSAGRDFYLPSSTPVGNGESSQVFDMHAKQTRLNLGTKTLLDNGKTLSSQVELDFMVSLDGNERATNGYEPEIRHAFIQYDQFILGQTWSNFMDVKALPDTLDFIGSSEGTVFVRQAQLRYTQGGLSVALENPETTLSTVAVGTTPVGSVVSGDGRLPDLTARYVHDMGKQGHVSAALLVRELRNDNNGLDDTEIATGVNLSGQLNLNSTCNLRGAIHYGQGIGRYVGANLVNDAVLDAKNQLHLIDVTAGFVAFQHQWQPKLRSSLGVSMFKADIPTDIIGTGLTEKSQSAHANLIYNVTPSFEVGAELLHGERELSSGLDGKVDRLQFAAKYSF